MNNKTSITLWPPFQHNLLFMDSQVVAEQKLFFFQNSAFIKLVFIHSNTVSKQMRSSQLKVGRVHLQSTRNNTICTLIDENGNTVSWSSAGSIGFKNTRKSTTYAAQAAAEKLAAKAIQKGFFCVNVSVKGLGYGKQSAVRALFKSGLRIMQIEEMTPVSYNGSRPTKKRRV